MGSVMMGGKNKATKYYRYYIQIGENIAKFRMEQNLTQMDLAEKANYSRNQIQRVEAATCAPTLPFLLDVAEALNVSLEQLLDLPNRER